MLLLAFCVFCCSCSSGKKMPVPNSDVPSGRIIVKGKTSDPRFQFLVDIPEMMYYGSFCVEPVVTQKNVFSIEVSTDNNSVVTTYDTAFMLIDMQRDSCYLFNRFYGDVKLLERMSMPEKNQGLTGNRHPIPDWRYEVGGWLSDTVIGKDTFMQRKVARTVIHNQQRLEITGTLFFKRSMKNFPDFMENFWLGSNSENGLLGLEVDAPYANENGNLTAYRASIWWEIQPDRLSETEKAGIQQMIVKAR